MDGTGFQVTIVFVEGRLVRFEIWPATSAVRPSVLAAAERLP